MIVVVEGPDNAGKSTLVKHLTKALNIPVVLGEGPGKSVEEINERVERYSHLDNVMFDRHPCVSQVIYNNFRKGYEIRHDLITEFYQKDALFIFCRGRPGTPGHIIKDHDTRLDGEGTRHEDTVVNNYLAICRVYESWAMNWAHVNYRIGDGYDLVTRFVAEATKTKFDPIADVVAFHSKFKQGYDGPPRILPEALAEFRANFMLEEATEWLSWQRNAESAPDDIANYTHCLEQQLDCICDELWVTIGTADWQGMAHLIPEAWRRVVKANMTKRLSTSPEDSKSTGRDWRFDIVKPTDWVAPSHVDLVERNELSLKR